MRSQRKPGKPLSIWIYLRRNKKVLPVLVVLAIAMFGITTLVTLLDSLATSQEIYYGRLNRLSVVVSSDPGAITRIRTNPHVEAVYPDKSFSIQVPAVLANTTLVLFAVPKENVNDLLTLYNARLIAGRLPNPWAAEFAVSEQVARARGWKLGTIMGPGGDNLDQHAQDFTLVGILESDERIGLIPFEYLDRQTSSSQGSFARFLVIPREGEKEAMDKFLVEEIASNETIVTTYDQEERNARQIMSTMYLVLGVIDILIIAVLSITTGMLNYIFLTQRMGEFALFHAIGFGKGRLARRILGELGVLACVAWLIGELLAMGALFWIGTSVFAPRGQDFYFFDLRAVTFTAPIPIIVVMVGVGTVMVLLSRLDPVSIIERRS